MQEKDKQIWLEAWKAKLEKWEENLDIKSVELKFKFKMINKIILKLEEQSQLCKEIE